jgi:hypothetical protein
MDKLKKFELMEKITNELEDLKNSQTAIVQKIGKIEIDNFDLGIKHLSGFCLKCTRMLLTILIKSLRS